MEYRLSEIHTIALSIVSCLNLLLSLCVAIISFFLPSFLVNSYAFPYPMNLCVATIAYIYFCFRKLCRWRIICYEPYENASIK
jgi:hypothetical protein